MKVTVLCVGKLKAPLDAVEADYLKRLGKEAPEIIELKSSPQGREKENAELLQKIQAYRQKPGVQVCVLTEHGKTMKTAEWSKFLETIKCERLVFVIGGAEGFTAEFLAQMNHQISLSPMTFPHQLARILLMEQYYRAYTIRTNHPYHNP